MINAIIVIDLGWGDAGKGTTVDYLARQHPDAVVVRFNGGCQAAHHVVLPGGKCHRFAQVGAGAFAGARTWLSRHVAVQPAALIAEMNALHINHGLDVHDRVRVDKRCAVTTPVHRAINRLREMAAGAGRHGSCGVGYGETVRDERRWPELTVRADDFDKPRLVRDKFMAQMGARWAEYLMLRDEVDFVDTVGLETVDPVTVAPFVDPDETANRFVDDCRRCAYMVRGDWTDYGLTPHTLIFEGAQGVMIDEHHGHHPHTTWSTTTSRNALAMLGELNHVEQMRVLGVTRTYSVRHGPGPFPVEQPGYATDAHNTSGRWQGPMRAGPLDLVALKYAAQVVGRLDGLVVTHCDAMTRRNAFEFCHGYTTTSAGVPVQVHRLPVDRFDPTEMTEDQFLSRREESGIAYGRYKPVVGVTTPAAMREVVEDCLEVPVVLTSHGPTFAEKRLEAPLPLKA